VRRRKTAEPPRDSPAGQLLALQAEAEAAAAGGDARAAALLAQTRSWLAMLKACGGDPQVGELFGIFAAEGKARMAEWWANPAAGTHPGA
jgi:hypothetical protein